MRLLITDNILLKYVTVYAFKEQSDEEVYAELVEVRKRTQ